MYTKAISAGGHDMVPNPAGPTAPDEDAVVTAITTVVNANNGGRNEDVASLFGVGVWSNVLTRRVIYPDTIDNGATGIGEWISGSDLDDLKAMTVEQRTTKEGTGTGNYGWWFDDAFKSLGSDYTVDIDIKFDPLAADGEIITLGGYILDDETGAICIKFGNSATVNTHKVAVDITVTRTNVSAPQSP